MVGGVPVTKAKSTEQEMAMTVTKRRGSRWRIWANGMAMGISMAAHAVLEMNAPIKTVTPMTRSKTAKVGKTVKPMSWRANQSETPVLTSKVPIASPPPKVSSAFQLILFKSSCLIKRPKKSTQTPASALMAGGIWWRLSVSQRATMVTKTTSRNFCLFCRVPNWFSSSA